MPHAAAFQLPSTPKPPEPVWSAKALTKLFNRKYHFYRDVLGFSNEKAREEAERFVDVVREEAR